MSSKITNALPELVEKGIISEETAQRIEAYYHQSEPTNTNRLFTIFGILGSTLIGLGIILIMAHNWDDFSGLTKVMLAFLPMILGQFFLGFSIVKQKSSTWKEAATVFLFFAVGACIALVAQIYNVPGNTASYLFTWVLVCAPLMYVSRSKAAIILHLIFSTYFAMETGYGRSEVIPQLYFVLLALSLPRYIQSIREKQTTAVNSILHWLFPLSFIISLPVVLDQSESLGFLLYTIVFGLLYNIGKLSYFTNKSLLQNGYRVLGSIGTVILLLIASFRHVWNELIEYSNFGDIELGITALFLVVACVLFFLNIRRKKRINLNMFQYAFLAFTIVFIIGLTNSLIATILTNILLFLLGIEAIRIGAKKMHFGILNYGMLIITLLIACRFFDTDISFALRGFLFVLIGVGFFVANLLMLRKRRSKTLKS